jgi:hypothetical protein
VGQPIYSCRVTLASRVAKGLIILGLMVARARFAGVRVD